MRIAVVLSMLALLVPAAATAGRGAPTQPTPPPPFPKISGQWSHVEINVTIKRVPHTVSLDRGRIVQISSTQLTLREKDGSTWVIPIDADTITVVGGLAAVPANLKKKMNVETMRIDNGPAVRVRTTR